jgi:hypothetical protein
MRTFSEFMAEAKKVQWYAGSLKGSKKSPANTAKQKQANLERQSRKKPSPKIYIRISKLKQGIKRGEERAEGEPRPETTATKMQKSGKMRKNTGYATFKDDPRSSVGTVEGHRRRRSVDLKTGNDIGAAEPSDTRTSGRYGTVPGGRGTRVSRSGGIIGT